MAAKLHSLAFVVLLMHLALNTLPGLWLPSASPFGYFRAAFALEVALLLQTVFACSLVVGLHGLVGLLLPRAAVGRASAVLQGLVLLGAALLFVAEGSISRLAFAMRAAAHPVQWLVPVVWFRALYVELLGVHSDLGWAHARLALVATLLALAVALPCSLLGFRDSEEEGRRHCAWRLLPRAGVPPVRRAIASFVGAALLRSAGAGLVARGVFLVGVALTLSGFIGLLLRDIGYSAPVLPAQPVLAPAFVLPFFGLVGLRLAAVYPSELEANWIFRLTELRGSAEYAAGVRRAALLLLLPLFGLLGVPYVFALGLRPAAALLGLALAVALVTSEWLFLGFAKVPFTCTYQPGKARLRVTWPKYAAIFVVYCAVLPRLAARALASPGFWSGSILVLALAWGLLVRLRDREARVRRLVFDDLAHPFFTLLHFERPVPPTAGSAPRVSDLG